MPISIGLGGQFPGACEFSRAEVFPDRSDASPSPSEGGRANGRKRVQKDLIKDRVSWPLPLRKIKIRARALIIDLIRTKVR